MQNLIAQSVFNTQQTPCRIQCETCLFVLRSASNTKPTPIAFLRAYVTYTGVLIVPLNLSLLASTGTICTRGISSISSFGR